MKIVVNHEYGAFRLPDEFCRIHNIENPYDYDYREDAALIEFVEKNPEKSGSLDVINIPKNATDYTVDDDDGLEYVIYVVDGKLHWAEAEDDDDYDE